MLALGLPENSLRKELLCVDKLTVVATDAFIPRRPSINRGRVGECRRVPYGQHRSAWVDLVYLMIYSVLQRTRSTGQLISEKWFIVVKRVITGSGQLIAAVWQIQQSCLANPTELSGKSNRAVRQIQRSCLEDPTELSGRSNGAVWKKMQPSDTMRVAKQLHAKSYAATCDGLHNRL